MNLASVLYLNAEVDDHTIQSCTSTELCSGLAEARSEAALGHR